MAGRGWLIGACVAAAAALAPAAEAAPGDVDAALEQLRQWLRDSGAGDLATSAPPVVTAGAAGDVVRLPGLVLESPDARIGFGDLELVRSDAAGGLWRLAGSLPPRITVEMTGLPAAVVTMERSSYTIEIDPRNGVLGDTAIEAGGLTAAVEPLGRMRIGTVTLGGDIEEGADGKATATSTYALSDVAFAPGAAGAPDQARLGGISMTGRIDGADWARLLRIQAFAIANAVRLEADGPAVRAELWEMLTTPGLPFDGLELLFAMERAWVGDLGSGGPVSLDEAAFHFGLAGLTGEAAGGRIGWSHRGLRIDAALPVDAAAVPETLGLEIGIERLPARQLLAAISQGAVDEVLLDLLRGSGTTARVADARIRMNGMGADLDAEITASPDAPDGVLGRAVLAVVNLDGIVRALGPLVADEVATIQALALTGHRSEAPAGTVTHRWTVAREADGRTTLNGNDIDALLREEDMASLTGRLGGGAEPAEPAASQAATGITADLVATRLEERGVAATVGEDDSGDPMVEAVPPHGPDGAGLGVLFFDCEPDGRCGSGMLYFTMPTAQPVALARINGWNGGERWVRAYRDEDQDLWLEMDLPGEAGGVAAVDAALERFLDLAARFADDMASD